MKLNKNQRAFFEEALPFFGKTANQAKLADINVFAEMHGLTVPTSFLSNHCKTEKRATYDLTKCGLDIDIKDGEPISDTPDRISQEEPKEQTVIFDQSIYGEPEKEKKLPDIFLQRDELKRTFSNPIYAIIDAEGDLYSVCDSPKIAYKNVYRLFHSGYSLTETQAVEALEKYGVVFLKSTNSNIKVKIIKMEMNE